VKPSGRLLGAAVLTILAAYVSGCGGGASSASTPSAEPTATSHATATAGPTKTLSVVLNPENGGTVQATLTLTIGSGNYVYHLEGHSLRPSGRYLVNTHGGTCAAEDTTQVQDVGTLSADAGGNGILERSLGRPYVGIMSIHDYSGSGNEYMHIACAELPTA
jgi:hypothetical protein